MERREGQWADPGTWSSGKPKEQPRVWDNFNLFLTQKAFAIGETIPITADHRFTNGADIGIFYCLHSPSADFILNLNEYLKVDKIKYAV